MEWSDDYQLKIANIYASADQPAISLSNASRINIHSYDNTANDKYQQALKFVIKEAFDDDGFYIGK